jgi:uncharacterized membrane protein
MPQVTFLGPGLVCLKYLIAKNVPFLVILVSVAKQLLGIGLCRAAILDITSGSFIKDPSDGT